MRHNSVRRQLHETESSTQKITVNKHHELPAGVVDGEVLAGVVTSFYPENTLGLDLALFDNQQAVPK